MSHKNGYAKVTSGLSVFGQTNIDENGSAQKYGKEYSLKSGDKFVLSVAKR